MSLFHHEKRADPLKGGEDGVFEVVAQDGRTVRYVPDDFDEIFTTTNEHEAGRHVGLGWLLLDEFVGRGSGGSHEELRRQYGAEGVVRTVAVRVPSGDVTTYVLGYLKPGRAGTPVA